MADMGHSVFAPYARARTDAGVSSALSTARAGSVLRVDHVRCEHDHQIALASLAPALIRRGQVDEPEDPSTRRTRIWEFNQNLHCSIIGTCLSTTELRQTLTRLSLANGDWTDHDLHHKGVSLAAKHDRAAKQLHKDLDRRHRLAISQFSKARDEAELTAMWRDAVKRGDIPGAYWAVLTHHAATPALVRLVFGEVHMLSHLVGAANRADIRRLCELERRNAELEEKLRRQQEALHQAVVTRDASIQHLRDALRQRLREDPPTADDGAAALRDLVADLEKRIALESRRRMAVEARDNETRDALAREREAGAALATEVAALRAELHALGTDLRPDEAACPWRVDGVAVLYVGGRPNQIAHLRALSEDRGATLLHHDGGIEHNPDLLAGLTSRADVVLFPVDCISHDAALMIKRLCRQMARRFVPLRSASATSFLAALRTLSAAALAQTV
jgi:hypothetical protein